MKEELLEVLQCPKCGQGLTLEVQSRKGEIRAGKLICQGVDPHAYEIRDGIVRFETGFDHEAVQKEIDYENSVYHGSELLHDPIFIAQFPESLPRLWPHLKYFGPDFRAMINQFDLQPSDWILDIGTGPCWSSRLMAERSARVVALDINEAPFYGLGTAEILFKHHGIFFERVLESMTHLPFQDGVFNYVTFNASLHHTPDLGETLRQCYRVLKPGGIVAMVNESFVSFRQRVLPKPGARTETDLGSHHEIDYRDFDREAKRLGFEVQYRVADHIKTKLREWFTFVFGSALVRQIERSPLLVQQLYSALIILRKPKTTLQADRSEVRLPEQNWVRAETVTAEPATNSPRGARPSPVLTH